MIFFFAYAINLYDWGEYKDIMTKSYVKDTIKSHFEVKNIIHSSLEKSRQFDGEKYIAYEDLKTPQPDRTVMDILRTCADGGS